MRWQGGKQGENRRRRGTGGLGWMNLGKLLRGAVFSTPAAEINLLGKSKDYFRFFFPPTQVLLKKKKKDFLNPESGTNMLSVLRRKPCG